jgi:hypothetical protein
MSVIQAGLSTALLLIAGLAILCKHSLLRYASHIYRWTASVLLLFHPVDRVTEYIPISPAKK